MATTAGSLVRQRQAPLRARYARDPRDAAICKRAHAERACVNLDTLRRGVPVTTRTRLDAAG